MQIRALAVVLALTSSGLAAPRAAAAAPIAPVAPASASATASAPAHSMAVSGVGVGLYPAFDPDVQRYAVTTTADTAGSVTLELGSDDPGTAYLVDGRPVTATTTLEGLEDGQEVSVMFRDGGVVRAYALVYLPRDFPVLERTTPAPSAGPLEPGLTLLTLGKWLSPSLFYETAVDDNGVPAHVVAGLGATDLKRQPNGHYSVSRPTDLPRTGSAVVELDDTLQEVDRHETVGLVNTDNHDSILLPDGTVWLMAYEPNGETGLVDSVVQRIDPDGSVGFEWSTAPYVDETVLDLEGPPLAGVPEGDYAHVNSFELLPDGDLLLSFRHYSSVWRVATSDREGVQAGDVVWRLGGRQSDFAITGLDGEPDGGPCAQHTARMLPDGDMVLFDNGSSEATGPLCVDPADPSGPAVARPSTRILTLRLDEAAGTAEVVKDVAPAGRFAFFAGSTQPLPETGNTLVGWASDTTAVASEYDDAGDLVWELRDPAPDSPYFTYRAFRGPLPDTRPPSVSVESPVDGTVLLEGEDLPATYGCTDRGGSTLQTCAGPAVSGGLVDTSTPGQHTFEVTATDGDGGATVVTRSYTVLARSRPDALVRVPRTTTFRGAGRYGPPSDTVVGTSLRRAGQAVRVAVRVVNDGVEPDQVVAAVTPQGGTRFRLAGRMAQGGTSPVLPPGGSWTFTFSVVRTWRAEPGDRVVVRVPVRSAYVPGRRDAVSVVVRAVRD